MNRRHRERVCSVCRALSNVCERRQFDIEGVMDVKRESMVNSDHVAQYLSIKRSAVRRLYVERGLPYHKIGGQIRFFMSEVFEWVKAQKQKR
jgi:excisionase family DNA binding protein